MNIVQATKKQYAALQHRASPDRTPLHFNVVGLTGKILTSGTIHVKAPTKARLKAEITKLSNRLSAMYPYEYREIEVSRDLTAEER